jgi:hypothetical protein
MRGLLIGGASLGLLAGLALGLVLAWFIWPVSYSNADPADLRLDLKDDYIRMIAASYSLDGDMARALQRLGVLQVAQPSTAVAALARRESAPSYQQALVRLALDLNQPAVALARPTFTPRPTRARIALRRTPSPIAPATATAVPATPQAAVSPLHTPAPEVTPLPPTFVPNSNAPQFQLKAKTALTCAETGGRARIEVDVQDAAGKPVPGVGVQVNWDAGDEIFYTGLKPERGMGYADLSVGPGTYNVRLTDTAQSKVVENLQVDAEGTSCAPGSAQVYGWRLVFQKTAN